ERQRMFAQASATASVQAISLRLLTGLEPGEIVLPGEPAAVAEAPLAEWVVRASGLPRVEAARTQAQAIAQQARAAWAQLLPRLEARGVQTFTNATGFANAPSYWQAMLLASVPLEPRAGAAAMRLEVESERLY